MPSLRLAASQSFQLFCEQAATCRSCHEHQLVHQREDGVWARPLFQQATTFRARVLFVAEAPNHDDTYDPKKGYLTVDPETDPSGQQAFAMLNHLGLGLEDVLFTNAAMCLPARSQDGKFPLKAAQVKQCSRWLRRLIEEMDPVAVVTLGAVPLHAVKQVERHRLQLRDAVGKLHPWYGRKLLPLYHPGRLGQIARLAQQQLRDIEALRPLLAAG